MTENHTNTPQDRPVPRIPRGFRDLFAPELAARRRMIGAIREVYERYGFEPLETPALEYVDVLGKFLPESDTPEGGIFALRDEDREWIALRYDLTAPLSRVVSQAGADLPSPFRRYQIGPVWRQEKPGPGRFREFYQCDFDTVGTASMAADAEVCVVYAEAFGALGLRPGDFRVKVNDRKVLNGVLDMAGLPADEAAAGGSQRLTVLRAIDKIDRLGPVGVRELLGKGRHDESGDFTPGAGLGDEQAARIMAFVEGGDHGGDRAAVCRALRELVGDSPAGLEGVAELETIHELLEASGLGGEPVVFDPGVVRGLAYYTGPVFEVELTFEIVDEAGNRRPFGSVAGGGRYDGLVERFTGTKIPATGASIGVDRLLAALRASRWLEDRREPGPVVVTVFDKGRLADYQRMVTELRAAGIAAELYLGAGGLKKQFRYADRRDSPVAVIAGGDEFARGEVSLKDMALGRALTADVKDRDGWLKQPAQVTVPRAELVARTRELIARARLASP
jgi:histidyl-tRNA synthetase